MQNIYIYTVSFRCKASITSVTPEPFTFGLFSHLPLLLQRDFRVLQGCKRLHWILMAKVSFLTFWVPWRLTWVKAEGRHRDIRISGFWWVEDGSMTADLGGLNDKDYDRCACWSCWSTCINVLVILISIWLVVEHWYWLHFQKNLFFLTMMTLFEAFLKQMVGQVNHGCTSRWKSCCFVDGWNRCLNDQGLEVPSDFKHLKTYFCWVTCLILPVCFKNNILYILGCQGNCVYHL